MAKILHIGFWPRELRWRRFEGIRRYAIARGLEVVPVRSEEVPDISSLRAALALHRPIGAVAEWGGSAPTFPPHAFGHVPVVFFDPPDRAAWRGALTVECDEEAVARTAFQELSTGLPPSFAMVSYVSPKLPRWARRREAAFRSLCAAAGKECRVFPTRRDDTPQSRAKRLAAWVAELPRHCAVFAIDDYRAVETMDAFAAVRRALPYTATLVGANGAGAPGGIEKYSISTVEIDFELSGYLAAKALLGVGGGSAVPRYGPMLVRRGKTTHGRGRHEPWILEAVEAIRREACDGLTAAALAARQTGSRRNFDRRFREAVGHSVLEEIRQVRLERVLTLLSNTNTPFGVISDMCGFGSEVELRQVFKARFGVSMTQWRSQHR